MLAVLVTRLGAQAAPAMPPVRIALMDFSTDDNSWRNSQAAANFTSLLQIQLADEPGVEWIERAQLDLARQELKLSEMELAGGASPIRCGKWAKADWLITGQFSLDDKNQRTLSVEVTELKHADVLASQTIKLPGQATPQVEPAQDQVKLAARAVHELLAGARLRQQETEDRVLVAPLFLVNLSRFGLSRGEESLPRGFTEALERAAATNRHVRFIRFPKAYQAMDESEMVLDGLVEADPQAWQQTADLYAWGSYAVTNCVTGGRLQSRLEITLHLWDGASPPQALREGSPIPLRDNLPPDMLVAILDRMADKVVSRARRQKRVADSGAIRRGIAESIAQTYRQLTGPTQSPLGLQDDTKFAQAVHMLETACFFDPDNADLQAMRITCRWGWWMDFHFKVKNQFWSFLRRSRAWGRYVDRFGLQPTASPLPFPYQAQGIPAIYVRSLEEVVGMFPQSFDADEEQEQQRGVHTNLMEAQGHGFPKDIPREVVLKWKAEVEAELADRRKKAGEYAQAIAKATNSPPSAPTNTFAMPPSHRSPSSPPAAAMLSSVAEPAPAPHGPSLRKQPLPSPEWLKEIKPQFSLFKLSPPRVSPSELKPAARDFQFPPQFEVRAVHQMGLCRGKLLILAMDERSAPSSDATPDLSAETLKQRGRLWSLDLEGQSPALFEPDLLRGPTHSFLLENGRLWVAGDTIGCLDLETRSFRQFGLREGLTAQTLHSLTVAGGRLFATGDVFKLYELEPGSSQWRELRLPPASLSTGMQNSCLVTGNGRWLGYLAGSALLYDVRTDTWTNLQEMKLVRCFAADDAGFWYGGYEGLQRYDLAGRSFNASHSSAGIQGLPVVFTGPSPYIGQQGDPKDAVNRIAETIHRFLKGLQKERERVHLEKVNHKGATDPLHLDWRMPGGVTALAMDGDFLWIGTAAYSGYSLLLVHKPSFSLVGCCRVDGEVSCLAVSQRDVWVGTAYGRSLLTRIQKQALFAIPRSQWLSLAISRDDRLRLVHGMSIRDQAMYAFYAGDDAQVAELLESLSPEKANVEEMFLLAFAYDASGLDRPDLARAWFERIGLRYPDSPWATAAREFLAASEEAHKVNQRQALLLAKYDRNHDGVLDQAERRAMEKDPAYQREDKAIQDDQLDTQLQEILRKYDRNGDGRLDPEELERLRSAVRMYSDAPPELLSGRKILVAPLLTRDFPPVETILKKYDTHKDGALDAAGLKALANDLKKGR